MSRGNRREGSTLAIVLVVLFTLTFAVGAFQYLASSTIRQYRVALRIEDGQLRADGLLEMIVSRWKKLVRHQSSRPVLVGEDGSEGGVWDGRPFVLAWKREPLDLPYPTDRAAVWIRFLDESTLRSYRYDLVLRSPFPLRPRLVEIVGQAVDTIDPSWSTGRSSRTSRPARDRCSGPARGEGPASTSSGRRSPGRTSTRSRPHRMDGESPA